MYIKCPIFNNNIIYQYTDLQNIIKSIGNVVYFNLNLLYLLN